MKVIKRIEVHPEGELTVFEQLVGVLDGERVAGEMAGRVVWPGDDVTAEVAQVRAVAAALHTPECIALYRARQAAGEAEGAAIAAKERAKSADAKVRESAQQEVAAALADANAKKQAVAAALATYETARHARAEKPKR